MNIEESTHLVLNFDTLKLTEETHEFLGNLLEEHIILSKGDLGYAINNLDPGDEHKKIQQELLKLYKEMGEKITHIISLSYK